MQPAPGSLQAVLFEVDGTLVDSERHGHRVAFNRAFEAAGMADRWDEGLYGELLKVTGGLERLEHYLRSRDIDESLCSTLARSLHEEKNRRFLELVEQGAIPPRPGVKRLIDELTETDIRLGLVTTGSSEWVEGLVEQHFGLRHFEVVVTGDHVSAKKPDPAAYEIALERLDLRAPAALAVEDSVPALGSAIAAGLTCVVVVNDYTKNEDFGEAGLILDGYGAPDERANVLSESLSVSFAGMLTARVLSAVHASAATGPSA